MNGPLELQNNPGDLQRWLDRLVDGELHDEQQRQLLLALETQPDAWRRCALAFIEGQAWRREMGGLVAERFVNANGEGAVSRTSAAGSRRSRSLVPRWLSIAASVLVAFTLGIVSSHAWRNDTGLPLEHSANPTLAAVSGSEAGSVEQNMVAADNTTPETAPVKLPSVQVSLPADDGGEEQSVEVPLVESNEQNWQSMLADRKPVLSDAELKTLRSTGHEVEQHRAFYPLKLDDGRQAVVPMDIVKVHNVGGWQ
jgi:hypothetical protein